MKKYIFINAEKFDSLIMIGNDIDNFNNQNRMDLFTKYYGIGTLEKEGYLDILSDIQMEKLKKDAIYYLNDEYMSNLSRSDKSKFPENYFSVKKYFLDKEYLLDPGEDRLAILALDLYNINLFAKEHNVPILYVTADTKAEAARLKF